MNAILFFGLMALIFLVFGICGNPQNRMFHYTMMGMFLFPVVFVYAVKLIMHVIGRQ